MICFQFKTWARNQDSGGPDITLPPAGAPCFRPAGTGSFHTKPNGALRRGTGGICTAGSSKSYRTALL